MGRAWGMGLVAVGCGDTLIGGDELDQRIGVQALPERAAWEVRWVGPSGLSVACERPRAEPVQEGPARFGTVRLRPPELAADELDAAWMHEEGFSWALALPVVVAQGSVPPPEGEGSLEASLGVWGTSAPLAWLQLRGDLHAAGERLRLNAGPLPEAGWVEVFSDLVTQGGSFDSSLARVDPYDLGAGVIASALQWSDDEELDLWSGDALGGIVSSCVRP